MWVVQVSSLIKPRLHFQIILKLFFFGNCWTFGSVCRNILCTFLELERNARLHVIGMIFAPHVWRIFHLTHDPSLFPDTASSLLRSAASHENLFMSVKWAFLSDIFTSIYVVEDAWVWDNTKEKKCRPSNDRAVLNGFCNCYPLLDYILSASCFRHFMTVLCLTRARSFNLSKKVVIEMRRKLKNV